MVPPITKETTITTTDDAGETIAIAIAAGAGVVGGAGALAAWLFKPVPGGPPAPTSPPPYSTASQPPKASETPQSTEASSSSSSSSSTSSQESYACPFTNVKADAKHDFTPIPLPTKWTAGAPQQSISSLKPACTQQGNNNQLFRGTDPGYVKALAEVFCKSNLSKDQTKTLGQKDLPDGNNYKSSKLDSIQIKFEFEFALKHDECPKNCVDSYSRMVTACRSSFIL